MRFNLNRWQCIGIILSVCWAVGGGFWGDDLGLQQGDWVISQLMRCFETQSIRSMQCDSEFARDYPEAIRYHWYYATIVAFVPVALIWLVVYGFIGLWRRTRGGAA